VLFDPKNLTRRANSNARKNVRRGNVEKSVNSVKTR
jgi:hypothetical protein